jgi:hypothetical protein
MPLEKLEFVPGIDREGTVYDRKAGWYSCDLVRFRFGKPERIGGWTKKTLSAGIGTPRNLHPWTALDGSQFIGVGTHKKYYIDQGGELTDVTPVRRTVVSPDSDNSISTFSNTTVRVTDAGHSAIVGDYVTLSGIVTFDGLVDAEVNAEQVVTNIVDGANWEFEVTTAASGTTLGSGGTAIQIDYQPNIGLDTVTAGLGWGTNTWETTARTDLSNIFDVTNTSAVVTVNDTAHGHITGDDVTITGVAANFNGIQASEINDTHTLTLVDTDSYTITLTTPATSTANGVGGTGIGLEYRGWGDDGTLGLVGNNILRLWSADNFGEDLLYNIKDGQIFYWDKSLGLVNRGVPLEDIAGADEVPTICRQIIVSTEDRHRLGAMI